jgi:hypothetical protein
MLYAELGYTNFVGQTFTDPRQDTDLLRRATVSYRAPERVDSGAEKIVDVSNPGFPRICNILANGDAQAAGVFEISTHIENYYLPVMSSVTFRLSDSWLTGGETPYWASTTGVLPIYAGLEFGIKDTGIFAYLRDDGADGSMVVGGPFRGQRAPRANQMELPLAKWKECAFNNGLYTIFFAIDPETLLAKVWKQAVWGVDNEIGDTAPVQIGPPIPIDSLGTFPPDTARGRTGATEQLVSYFGNGSSTRSVSIVDFAIYRFFSPAVIFGIPYNRHSVRQSPDLPLVYRSSDGVLPTGATLGRWLPGGATAPDTKFWFQPGRKTSPLYTEITKVGTGTSYITREETRLSRAADFHLRGFSVETWMGGDATTGYSDKGFGFQVTDGTYRYRVTALDVDGTPTYGIERTGSTPSDAITYFIPRVGAADVTAPTYAGTPVKELPYTGLRLIRMTYNRDTEEMSLFVEDPDEPVLIVPRSVSVAFPYPESTDPGSITIGHFLGEVSSSALNLDASSILPDYASWEKRFGTPDDVEAPYTFIAEGQGRYTAPNSEGSSLVWDNYTGTYVPETPPTTPHHPIGAVHIWRRNDEFVYYRGFQVDFKAVITSPVTPNSWTGVGVTVFMGNEESPSSYFKKVHVGFFDCGISGRKVGVVTSDNMEDIIKQTYRGRRYSATWDWGRSDTEQRNLRLLYRPFMSIEVWDSTLLKGAPLITIPWSEFVAETDVDNNDPGIAFGIFNSGPDTLVVSEWDYVRWGIAAGEEISIAQDIVIKDDTQGGRLLLKLSAGEHLDVPGDGHNPIVAASTSAHVTANDSSTSELAAEVHIGVVYSDALLEETWADEYCVEYREYPIGPPTVEAAYGRFYEWNTYDPETGYFPADSGKTFEYAPDANEVFLIDASNVPHAGTYVNSELIIFPPYLELGGQSRVALEYLIYTEAPSNRTGHFSFTKLWPEELRQLVLRGRNLDYSNLVSAVLYDMQGHSTAPPVTFSTGLDTLFIEVQALVSFGNSAYVVVTTSEGTYDARPGTGTNKPVPLT